MYEVTVEDSFAAGHYLRNYKGKCENPHGHNYKVRVTLAGKELDKAGLLLDFKDLREVMKHATPRYTLRAAKKLRSLRIPALIVWQRAPSAVFPKFHGRRLARLIPDARFEEVRGTLAFVPEDQPERLAQLIKDFVPLGAAVR